MIWSVDSETTGVDMRHGARPFFVTVCDEKGDQLFWEWDMDPLGRRPVIPPGDLDEIRVLINEADGLVLQNAKFDVTALATIGIDDWPWHKTEDTLIASHVLASNQPHDLTSLAVRYLGWNIQPYEDALEEVVQQCRRHCRSHYKDWLIAKKDLTVVEGQPVMKMASHQNHYVMPSAKDKCWKFDMWLPRTLVKHWWDTSMAGQSLACGQNITRTRLEVLQGWEFAPPEIRDDCPATSMTSWWTLLRDYSNADSAATAALWKELVRELKRRDLWEIYMAARRKPGIAYRMENRGVTVSQKRLHELTSQYREESASCSRVCKSIARMYDQHCPDCAVNDNLIFGQYASADCTRCGGSGKVPYELELPRGGVNNSLKKFVSNILQLPPIYNKRARSSSPTLGKEAIVQYLNYLSPTSLEHKFIQKLGEKRQRDTALSYMASYQRFWIQLKDAYGRSVKGWYVLHPSLNPTGTDTLRWSSSNPNEQNISKREGFNLRYCFGPAPGREWWSLDAKNIELRIPAYASGEKSLIALFEKPDEPPYYGSTHLLNFSAVYPDIWKKELMEVGVEKVGPHCKKKYASTWYQWCKNGGFKLQYGGIDADPTFHKIGATNILRARFSKLEDLNQKCIYHAEKYGYVETLPSKAINPKKGYSILCTRTEFGHIKPTVPLNYMVQSTAMEWMQQAMWRCDEQIEAWRAEGFDGYMILQVHDELVFDLPKAAHPKEDLENSNLWRMRIIQKHMEQGGEDIGVPTPVSCEYHEESWAEGVTC